MAWLQVCGARRHSGRPDSGVWGRAIQAKEWRPPTRDAEAWIAPLVPLGLLAGHGRSLSCWTACFPPPTSGCSAQTRATSSCPLQVGVGDDRHAFACRRSSRPQPMALCGPRRRRAGFAVLAGVLLVPDHGPLGAAWRPSRCAPCWRCWPLRSARHPAGSTRALGLWSCSLVPLCRGSGTTRCGLRLVPLWC